MGGDEMNELGAAEADEEDVEAEGLRGWGVGGGAADTRSYRYLDSGCSARRDNPLGCPQWLQRADPPSNALDSAGLLSGEGKVCVQLLQELGAASPLPAW